MKWLGCSWTDLQVIPADLVPVILEEMKAEDEATRRSSRKS